MRTDIDLRVPYWCSASFCFVGVILAIISILISRGVEYNASPRDPLQVENKGKPTTKTIAYQAGQFFRL